MGVKRWKHEAEHSLSSSADVKNAWNSDSKFLPSTPPWCVAWAQGQLYR